METRRMWPEVIISGFVWLVAAWSIIIWSLGLAPEAIWYQAQDIFGWETSKITIVSAGVVGASYFIGTLANRLLSTLFEFIEKIFFGKRDRKLTEMMSKAKDWELRTHEDRYSTKLMFRSVMVALAVLFFANIRWVCSSDAGGTVTWIFTALVLLCGVAFWRQKKFHEEFSEELAGRGK